MRFPPILAASLCFTSALGCAGFPRSTVHAYRQEGIPPAASGEVPASIVRIDGGAEYLADATISSSQVLSVRTVVRNRGSQLVTYDLARIVIAAADGAPLRLVGTVEEPAAAHTERPSPNTAGSIRTVAPGQEYAIVRRYELVEGFHRSRDALLLARISLSDAMQVGARVEPVTLRLEEVR